MSSLNSSPEIIQMARELEVPDHVQPVPGILDYCHRKIRKLSRGKRISTLGELEVCLCEHFGVTIIEIWNDEQLKKLTQKYVDDGEVAFAYVAKDLRKRYATLFARRVCSNSASDRYVALIDCRGEKRHRRWFSRWHEIAHLLTLIRQLKFIVHRDADCPEERLMDEIAGRVGYYEPIFGPIVDRQLRGKSQLSFLHARQIRNEFCPDASMEATLIAIIRRLKWPAVLIEAQPRLKKSEKATLQSGSPHPNATLPVPRLRITKTVANDLAREMWRHIYNNMRVPGDSLISRHYYYPDEVQPFGDESLEIWVTSDGSIIGRDRISVEARHIDKKIVGLIQLKQ